MKTAIIYFTGTGNSLAVARLLAARLPEAAVISVKDLLRRSSFIVDADACGFVFPVYCQDVPEMVQRAVRLMQSRSECYVFAVATHNGDPGFSHFTIDGILRKKGQHLRAGFAVLMPGNSITPYDFTNAEEEKQRRIQAAKACVDEIAGCVLRRESRPYVGSASLRKRFKGFRNRFRHTVVHKVPQKFWATGACNRCGICEKICPENNIHVGADAPIWGTRCQMCLACIHWCPVQAVQNGQGTLERKRYHHPAITLADMLLKQEAQDTIILGEHHERRE